MRKKLIIILVTITINVFSFSISSEASTLLKISKFSGALIFEYQSTNESFLLEDQLISDIDRDYFEYGLNLRFNGSVYHPGLLTFNVDLKLLSFKLDESIYALGVEEGDKK